MAYLVAFSAILIVVPFAIRNRHCFLAYAMTIGTCSVCFLWQAFQGKEDAGPGYGIGFLIFTFPSAAALSGIMARSLGRLKALHTLLILLALPGAAATFLGVVLFVEPSDSETTLFFGSLLIIGTACLVRLGVAAIVSGAGSFASIASRNGKRAAKNR